jgi:hypothetical protein
MPRVPDPLGTPKSLGGLAERAGFEIEQSELNEIQPSHEKVSDLEALRERTEDWTEDIEEADILQNALLEEAKSASEDNEEFSSEIEIE